MTDSPEQKTILIVEDQAIVAMDLAAQFEAEGYRAVGVVATAEDVIPAVQKHRPSVVLMDVRINGATDGISLAEEIFVCENTPVVILSAFADRSAIVRAVRSGAYGYLTKPTTNAALTSTVEMAVNKHQAFASHQADTRAHKAIREAVDTPIIELTRNGQIQYLNPAATRLTGWDAAGRSRDVPVWASHLAAQEPNEDWPETIIEPGNSPPVTVWVQKIMLAGGVCIYLLHPHPREH